VLQFPDGVTWHDNATVYVLVAIAAQSDEHLDILRHLTRGQAKLALGKATAGEVRDALESLYVMARVLTITLNPALDLNVESGMVNLGNVNRSRTTRLEACLTASSPMWMNWPNGSACYRKAVVARW